MQAGSALTEAVIPAALVGLASMAAMAAILWAFRRRVAPDDLRDIRERIAAAAPDKAMSSRPAADGSTYRPSAPTFIGRDRRAILD